MLKPVQFDRNKVLASCKAQVNLFLSMIAGKWARVEEESNKNPLAFIDISEIISDKLGTNKEIMQG